MQSFIIFNNTYIAILLLRKHSHLIIHLVIHSASIYYLITHVRPIYHLPPPQHNSERRANIMSIPVYQVSF